jgi:hypothetical protein
MDATNREQSTQADSAETVAEAGARELVRAQTPARAPVGLEEPDLESVMPLIHKVVAPPLAEFDKLMGDLEEAKKYLQAEGERIRRETDRYIQLTQTASESVRIISDAIGEWRKAGHPLQ